MPALKKIWKFISSMPFAIGVMGLLAAVCCLVSFITQGQSFAAYSAQYGERTAAVILALGLDDAFHSWWFVTLSAFLALSLFSCSAIRFPRILRRVRQIADIDSSATSDLSAAGIGDPQALFKCLGLPKGRTRTAPEGRKFLVSVKNVAGYFGAWVCHVGLLLLILGFGLGQMTQKSYSVYGVPGQTKPIGDTGYDLRIESFDVQRRADGSVEQYTAGISVLNGDSSAQASISVNQPAGAYGFKFYQNSYGWAATVTVSKGDDVIQREVLCAGEYLRVKDLPDLVVNFNAFYPDYVQLEGRRPDSASDAPVNPGYLYSVYYQDQMIGMNVLLEDDVLTIDDYSVVFSEPQMYTLVQVKRDRFTPLALLGGLITMIGLIMALYLQPVRAWAVQQPDGMWTVCAVSRRGGALFRERFEEAVSAAMKGDGTDASA